MERKGMWGLCFQQIQWSLSKLLNDHHFQMAQVQTDHICSYQVVRLTMSVYIDIHYLFIYVTSIHSAIIHIRHSSRKCSHVSLILVVRIRWHTNNSVQPALGEKTPACLEGDPLKQAHSKCQADSLFVWLNSVWLFMEVGNKSWRKSRADMNVKVEENKVEKNKK